MADKKWSFIDIIFLIVLICLLLAAFGCASQPRREDSNHYRAQAQVQQGYPCPECGFSIPMKDISSNIRIENKCPNCGKIFFGVPMSESSKAENYQRGYGNYGPRNYGPTSVYQSDVNYQRFGVGGYSFKETPTGFSELSWHFHDSKVKSYRVTPHWTTTRYHYP